MCKGNLTKQQEKVINDALHVIDEAGDELFALSEAIGMAARALSVKRPEIAKELVKTANKLDATYGKLWKLTTEGD